MSEIFNSHIVAQLAQEIKDRSITESISILLRDYPHSVTFSTSFSYEDQVITDFIHRHHLPVSLFTLDTGRLFPETYSTWSRTLEFYQTTIKAYYPDATDISHFLQMTPYNWKLTEENKLALAKSGVSCELDFKVEVFRAL